MVSVIFPGIKVFHTLFLTTLFFNLILSPKDDKIRVNSLGKSSSSQEL